MPLAQAAAMPVRLSSTPDVFKFAMQGMFTKVVVAALLALALQGCDDTEVVHPECSTFNKNNVGAVTDAASCREACVTAEGLAEVNGQLEDWKGSSGAGKCECAQSGGSRRTACEDSSYSS
mmetsp:Transcript_50639/g.94558  ORF Transcript_50639/g.94558 Transcript_50639/m.94558 type:complete len:121 (+) Transcript_50639:13-375(+)